jgi:anhydro-N-acetylmuramic acid kinase
MKAIGLMSGTSMDGIDIALLETDGERIDAFGATSVRPYARAERELLRNAVAEARQLRSRDERPAILAEAENLITESHAALVKTFLRENRLGADNIGVIGFHGQTVLHRPEDKLTVQIGSGQRLADLTGIRVVYDFRANDVAAGGQGAPFVPVYHRALALGSELDLPAAVINIGGVANVTWIGPDGDLLAFDTGPGNALLDDWVRQTAGLSHDVNGELAARGTADSKKLEAMLRHAYFLQRPPKSLDRDAFSLEAIAGMSLEDGAATLTAFTAGAIVLGLAHVPMPTRAYVVVGGGAHNGALMAALRKLFHGKLVEAESLGWLPDNLEAQAFAFLAVRSLFDMPLSFPTTTGVGQPMPGGILAAPAKAPSFTIDGS